MITIENTDGSIPLVKFSREFFFHVSPSVRPLVVGFFISDSISDGTGNYRRLVFRRTNSVCEVVSKNVTNELRALHRRNQSVGIIV
jgi:hypothetical protein